VLASLPVARQESLSSLRDSLPEFIDDLVKALDKGLLNVKEDISRFAHKHGSERAFKSHYSIEEALIEYNVLRQVLLEKLESAGPLDPKARDIILDAIGIGKAKAGAEYSKLQMRELRASFRRLQEATDMQPALIAQVSREHRYMFVNKMYEEWFGLPREKILGMSIEELAGPEVWKIARPAYEKAFKGERVTYEAVMPFAAGERYIHALYAPGLNEKGEIDSVFLSIYDISEIKLKEHRLRESESHYRHISDEQKATLEALHEETILRDKFVSTLSHDLRTPLTAARISAELIRRKFHEDPAPALSTRIVDNLDRANKMIEDLLDASKVRAGEEIIPEIGETDVVEVTRRTLEDLSTIHGDRFVLTSPSRLEAFVDPAGFRRILENLCSNAIKYGAPNSSVTIHLRLDNGQLILSVHNKGNPAMKIDKDKLFEPFHRGEGASSKKGWGIGLTIVKGITEAHRGEVKVDTTEQGTTFTIRIPTDVRRAREELPPTH
jgi:PAS domain S-box-containing protein